MQDDNISDINYSTAELTTVKKHQKHSHPLNLCENDLRVYNFVELPLKLFVYGLVWVLPSPSPDDNRQQHFIFHTAHFDITKEHITPCKIYNIYIINVTNLTWGPSKSVQFCRISYRRIFYSLRTARNSQFRRLTAHTFPNQLTASRSHQNNAVVP